MTADIKSLDAHEQPSDELRAKWKAISRADPRDLLSGQDIDDVQDPQSAAEFCLAGTIPVETLDRSFRRICPEDAPKFRATEDAKIYFHPLLPGLLIVPSLVPPEVQKVLLRHLIHRDLSQPHHQTNLHPHFDLPYPSPNPNPNAGLSSPSDSDISFFSYSPASTVTFAPKDPSVHKPLTVRQVLERRLHWVTLGGQYDWTRRVYPEGEAPPPFPPDLAGFLEALFPETRAQAAIVNFYTPGDTMMMHRDVSEETDKGLVSLSLGCEALFMIAPSGGDGRTAVAEEGEENEQVVEEEDEKRDGQKAGSEKQQKKQYLLLRLRSGDAIYMTKESRFAWHGVPKVLKGTCPEYLEDWPAEGGKYEEWRGWMRNKRINLNVRQMRD